MFYCFSQNNSYGELHEDGDVQAHVIIEANSVEGANDRAERIGIYFNGIENGLDCSCCGDRWHTVSSLDGTEA